jgi:hypothetical protein
MNFLTICQKANTLAGMQGTVSSTTVSSGYQTNLIEFCRQAYVDLQEYRKDWPWMRKSVTFNTVASTTEYSLQTIWGIGVTVDLQRWIEDMLLYVDSNNYKNKLDRYTYDMYNLRNVEEQQETTPSIYAQDPVDKHLYINPPDDAYSVECHYYSTPVYLTESTDPPLLPESYHLWIAYQGAAHMAHFMGNSNLSMTNQSKADAMLGNLLRGEYPNKYVKVIGAA